MGIISPIPNLIPLTTTRPTHTALEPPPMERAESTARTGDETFSQSGGEGSSGGQGAPDDVVMDVVEDAPSGEAGDASSMESDDSPSPAAISFFA